MCEDHATEADVYMAFGRAARHAQHLEATLKTVITMTRVLRKDPGFVWPSDPAQWPEAISVESRKVEDELRSFGAAVRETAKQLNLGIDRSVRLELALVMRNELANTFFVDHGVELLTANGRRKMLDHLAILDRHLQSAMPDVNLLCVGVAKMAGLPPSTWSNG